MMQDSRLSSVLHALLHMAELKGPVTSEYLSKCLSTNPVVVRRTMGLLRDARLVTSEKGRGGGWRIATDLSAVSLYDLYCALGEPSIFAVGHRNSVPECLVEQSVNSALDDVLTEAEALLVKRLQTITLASLATDFSRRHTLRKKEKP